MKLFQQSYSENKKNKKTKKNLHFQSSGDVLSDVKLQRPFEEYVGSTYYSESALCGCVVTISFLKYLPWQVMHFLQWSTHFSKTMLQTIDHLEICLGPPFSWLEKPINYMEQDMDSVVYVLMAVPVIHFFQAEHRIQFRSCSMWFLGFSNHEKGALKREILKWSTVCRTFLRSRWSIVRSASLAKGSTTKKRLSLHLHEVPTWVIWWVHKLCKQPSYKAHIYAHVLDVNIYKNHIHVKPDEVFRG
jgi:hypothetical protein